MAVNAVQKIYFNNFDNLFGKESDVVTEVSPAELHTFKGHPFRVTDDDKMNDLAESIKERGVLVPAIVRPLPSGGYELISGHRRKHACEINGLQKMPVIIRDLSDDEATVIMVDSNIQREELLPSEKAFAYKMKLNAIKKLRRSAQIEQKGTVSAEVVANEVGESRANIQRYIRLTYLIEELLTLVDEKKIPLNVGVELSFLPPHRQVTTASIINRFGIPTIMQAMQIKSLSGLKKDDDFRFKVSHIMMSVSDNEKKEKTVSIKFQPKIKKYFPKGYTAKQMEEKIIELLETYYSGNQSNDI